MKFDLSKPEYEKYCDELMLNEEYSKIFELRIKNYSIVEIASILNISESTVNRRIKTIKKKLLKIL